MSQQMLIKDGTCCLCKGHTSCIIFASISSSGSALVKFYKSSRWSDNIGKLSIKEHTIISISSVKLASCLNICGPLDNASVIIKYLPWIYFTLNLVFLKSYQPGKLSANCHFVMASEGFLCDCISSFLP